MANTQSTVYRLSHSRRFLWRLAAGLIFVGILSGWVVHRFTGAEEFSLPAYGFADFSFDDDETIEQLKEQLKDTLVESLDDPDLLFARKLEFLADSVDDDLDLNLSAIVRGASFSEEQELIAKAMLEALESGREEPAGSLLELAARRPLIPDANYALGLFWLRVGRLKMAAEAFEEEGTRPSAKDARSRAVNTYLGIRDFAALDRLYEIPEYDEVLRPEMPWLRFQQAIEKKDWPGIIRWLIPSQFNRVAWPIYVMALIVGLAWLAFLLHSARAWFNWQRILLCLVAILLGIMSTWATILMLIWQEDFLGLKEGTDVIGGLLYFIGGVGLREELLKFLFFLPLVPFLVRRGNRVEMLIVAGCVGLGFAIEENISYFHMSDAMSGPGRFLTANFFHISATGLIGLAFCQMVADRGRSLDNFATVFGVIVIAHGLYDALLSIPQFGDLGYFAMVVYALLCLQMFRVLNYYRDSAADTLSLTCVFTTGLAVVLATVLGYQISQLGLTAALRLMIPDTISLGAIIIMFFLQINESIQD